jgi:predicted LPLAT superfamily acyltransferase
MMRALAVHQNFHGVNAVIYSAHAPRFSQVLARSNVNYGLNLVHVSEIGPDTAITLSAKVGRGEVVVIVGDRTPPSDNGRVTFASFLGGQAPFAQGPWLLASLLECPVYLFFCVRGRDGYEAYFEHFSDRIHLPRYNRESRFAEIIQRYAQRLEKYCLMAPYQWFNFYDFWNLQVRGASDKR